MPILTMWIVCKSGVSHSRDRIATLSGVDPNHYAKSYTVSDRLVRAGGPRLLTLLRLLRRVEAGADRHHAGDGVAVHAGRGRLRLGALTGCGGCPLGALVQRPFARARGLAAAQRMQRHGEH